MFFLERYRECGLFGTRLDNVIVLVQYPEVEGTFYVVYMKGRSAKVKQITLDLI